MIRHIQVARIPEQFAVVGKWIKIGNDDHWRVTGVGSDRFTTRDCDVAHQTAKNHRKTTDI